MSAVARTYNVILFALAAIGGAMLALMFLSIIFDVTVRQLGFQPPEWAVPLSEYLLLYSTLLASPWLLREKGHVFIDLLIAHLRGSPRRWLERIIYVVCAAACMIVAIFAAHAAFAEFSADTMDVRAILVPKWMLFAPLAIGFLMMAIEFLRFLSGRDSMYAGEAGLKMI
jgi:C4-dicarboxylate transporter DctQ subunit